MSVTNSYLYPAEPEHQRELNPVEERLIALRLPFMHVRELVQCPRRNVPDDAAIDVNINEDSTGPFDGGIVLDSPTRSKPPLTVSQEMLNTSTERLRNPDVLAQTIAQPIQLLSNFDSTCVVCTNKGAVCSFYILSNISEEVEMRSSWYDPDTIVVPAQLSPRYIRPTGHTFPSLKCSHPPPARTDTAYIVENPSLYSVFRRKAHPHGLGS
ncbi:hypothetical protein HPB51_029402 [Rhipicephalus microplus]|uniref:Uncharacterized protein n=1 Tax=Rhipicephalus microplus TaxID=6941 RepID=A0A9J6CU65_RHIMP|nr:hypothetical protein HPB51_029402 [Rhipicephalus microplus]